jgi:predicted ATP-grasp superfamily ATP-dependent carboligase
LRAFLDRYAGDVDHVRFLDTPKADHPPLICAFRGWNDGGEAASMALRFLQERAGGRVFAHLDPEEFFDFQVIRPTVRLEGGVTRVIEWPQGDFAFATVDGRDIAMFSSAEPNNRWRTFAKAIVEVAGRLGSGLLVTLGAFLTDVPHTRAAPVVGSAGDEETAERLGLRRSRYEGPTGIVGVLHDASLRSGLPSVSLWAAVPHYIPSAPNPKAALALVRRACALLGLGIDTSSLARAADAWEKRVAMLLQESDELADYVARLEAAADRDGVEFRAEESVSGDAIAAELERFLRQHEEGGRASGDARE